jgi:hypothetical protein
MIKTFSEDVYVQPANNFNTAIVDGNFPASASYIDVSQFERFAFLVKVGTLTSALTLQVKQDTDETETANIKNVTDATVTVAATDDNELVSIEVEVRKLDLNNGFRYVTLAVSGAAGGDDYLDIQFIGINPDVRPVDQPDSYSQAVIVAG